MARPIEAVLMEAAWSAMWVALGGDPDNIVLPSPEEKLPEAPAEFVAQVRGAMIEGPL